MRSIGESALQNRSRELDKPCGSPRWVPALALGLTGLLLVGCASVPKRTPVPDEMEEVAEIAGIDSARYWGDMPPRWSDAWFNQTRAEVREQYSAWFGEPHNYLAISGGGAKGAFGAGLLAGWTASGNRPEFQMVTGISTGALTAPFAFLGPEYDHVLEEIYTTYSTDDLLNRRNPFNMATSDAVFSTKRLAKLIARYFDEELVEALAVEARKGRNLNIGTTNLDLERPVIWRITEIAASGEPGAVDLIRSIILASASIPGAFPPVPIDVEVNGRTYQELHADGGATSQVFLYPAGIEWNRVLEKVESNVPPNVYVIRNSRLTPKEGDVKRKLLPIVGRTISSLIRTQGIGDLYRIYALAERDGLSFNLAFVPGDFDEKPTEQFDPAWMRKLFDLGYEMGEAGYPWLDAPPEFDEMAAAD